MIGTKARRLRRAGGPLVAALLLPAATAPAAEAPYLLSMGGPPAVVRYAPGALDRADQVAKRMSRLVAEIGNRNLRQQLLTVELLQAEAWRQAGLPEPYGLPAISGAGTLALPAWGDAETVALWRRLLDGALPAIAGTPLRGSSQEASSLEGADLVAEVEASRIILAKLGFSGSEPWVSDLLACALAVSAVRRHEPERWAEVRQIHARLAAQGEATGDERLARLACIDVAARIGSEIGKRPARPLLKMARKSKGPLGADKLLERFPWLAESAPARRSG